MTDSKTQSAVIRQLEIIGEAVKNLSKAMTDRETGVPWRQIAGARDRLIHAYFNVDIDAVWSMVEQDLPPPASTHTAHHRCSDYPTAFRLTR